MGLTCRLALRLVTITVELQLRRIGTGRVRVRSGLCDTLGSRGEGMAHRVVHDILYSGADRVREG